MTSKGYIILLIEDSQSTRFMYRNILDKAGYFVLEAPNGEMGLELINKHHPDLIILDLILPGMHGHEVLKKIRSNPKTCLTPVLVLTNVKDSQNIQKTMSSGASHYANKESVTDQHILDLIKGLLKIS